MDQPRFDHGCPRCTFLGQWNEFDLYFCPQGSLPTVIARRSSEGPDYTSGMALAHLCPELGEARRRAQEKGLL